MANYLNNRQLLIHLTDYREKCQASPDKHPYIPKYIGEAVYLICTRIARRSNFCGYTYLDDMTGDAIENCIRATKNFDPSKSNNPFGYFSRVAWNAFVRRINTEREQTYVKLKNFENLHVLDETGEFRDRTGRPDVDGPGGRRQVGNEFTDNFIREFEKREKKKRSRKARRRTVGA